MAPSADKRPIAPHELIPFDEEMLPAGNPCMLVEDCDLGQDMRKVISHYFGRNKNCTKRIPDHAWCHFCRKHYQRQKYHNQQYFGALSIELVIRQVYYVRNWERENRALNRPGIVEDWLLIPRRRERLRLQQKQRESKAPDQSAFQDTPSDPGPSRSQDTPSDPEASGSEQEGRPAKRQKKKSSKSRPVPVWLEPHLDKHYSTDELLVVLRKLQGEIGDYDVVPDIEVLPQFADDEEGNPLPKPRGQKKTTQRPRAAPARSQMPRPPAAQPALGLQPLPQPYTNPYLPGPAAANPYFLGPAVANPYLPGPAVTNPYLPDPAVANPYLPGPAAANPYLPDPAAAIPYLPDPAAANSYFPLPDPTAARSMADDWASVFAPVGLGNGYQDGAAPASSYANAATYNGSQGAYTLPTISNAQWGQGLPALAGYAPSGNQALPNLPSQASYQPQEPHLQTNSWLDPALASQPNSAPQQVWSANAADDDLDALWKEFGF